MGGYIKSLFCAATGHSGNSCLHASNNPTSSNICKKKHIPGTFCKMDHPIKVIFSLNFVERDSRFSGF